MIELQFITLHRPTGQFGGGAMEEYQQLQMRNMYKVVSGKMVRIKDPEWEIVPEIKEKS